MFNEIYCHCPRSSSHIHIHQYSLKGEKGENSDGYKQMHESISKSIYASCMWKKKLNDRQEVTERKEEGSDNSI